MFTGNKSKSEEIDQKGGSINLIGAGTEITGNILTKGDLRIDGQISGDVNSKAKIVLGSGGQVNGDVTCQTAEISGLVNGNLSASETLFLKTSARIKGDISASKLVVENGAIFNGHCHVGAGFTNPEITNAKPGTRQGAKVPQHEESY